MIRLFLLVTLALAGCKKKVDEPPSVEFTKLTTSNDVEFEIYIVERGGFCFAITAGASSVAMVQVDCTAWKRAPVLTPTAPAVPLPAESETPAEAP